MTELEKMIARTRVLLSDQEDKEFTDEEIMAELNAENVKVNDELGYYVRDESLPIIEDQLNYDLPDDCMRAKRLRIDGPRGPELRLQNEADVDLNRITQIEAIRETHNSFSLTEPFTADGSAYLNNNGSWAE